MGKPITYTRPSGTEITVADTPGNKALAVKLGWVVKVKSGK